MDVDPRSQITMLSHCMTPNKILLAMLSDIRKKATAPMAC